MKSALKRQKALLYLTSTCSKVSQIMTKKNLFLPFAVAQNTRNSMYAVPFKACSPIHGVQRQMISVDSFSYV